MITLLPKYPKIFFEAIVRGFCDSSSHAKPRIDIDHRRTPVDSLTFKPLSLRRIFFPLSALLLLVSDVGPKRVELTTLNLVFAHQHILNFGGMLGCLLKPIADRLLLVSFHAGEACHTDPFCD